MCTVQASIGDDASRLWTNCVRPMERGRSTTSRPVARSLAHSWSGSVPSLRLRSHLRHFHTPTRQVLGHPNRTVSTCQSYGDAMHSRPHPLAFQERAPRQLLPQRKVESVGLRDSGQTQSRDQGRAAARIQGWRPIRSRSSPMDTSTLRFC